MSIGKAGLKASIPLFLWKQPRSQSLLAKPQGHHHFLRQQLGGNVCGFNIQAVHGLIPAPPSIPQCFFGHFCRRRHGGKMPRPFVCADVSPLVKSCVHPSRTDSGDDDSPFLQFLIQGTGIMTDECLGTAVEILIGSWPWGSSAFHICAGAII